MPRLVRVDVSRPGISRERRGEGWVYRDVTGAEITDPATVERIDKLVLPPAWTDVWISPRPQGHIQATGLDARGRRQYRYHDDWRTKQDRIKFDRALDFGASLPAVRAVLAEHLALPGMPRERALACAVRLLDLGFFRIGSEEYVEANHSYGLATLRREHVTVSRAGVITFDYTAKSGKRRVQSISDEAVLAVVSTLKRRRNDPSPELLAYRRAGGWCDVKSEDVNTYLREVSGGDYSAKDFRTWSATVLAAVALAVSAPAAESPTARKRAITRAVKETSEYLGNTPTVCRASYIDPRVIDLFQGGVTISEDLDRLGAGVGYGSLATQGEIEAAVLRMLREEARPGVPRRTGEATRARPVRAQAS